jgi:hypothetical protein
MALMKSLGVPAGNQYYAMNPYIATNLADAQNAIASGDHLVKTAWEDAQISSKFAGLRAITTDSLSNRTNGACADRAGAITATAIDQTYVTAKDTMLQTWELDGISNSGVVKAGEVVEVTGKYFIHPKTRQTFMDETGNPVKFRAVVTADATAHVSTGVITLIVTGPALYETNGQYNTINAALAEDDVVTVLGTTAELYQPNLFYHRDAFSMATVHLPKLYSTDTRVITKDGIAIRVSKYSSGDANSQSIRIDMLPAFAVLNPFFAGQGFGKS